MKIKEKFLMARQSKEQIDLKLKALWEAFEDLKKNSIVTNVNKITFENICNLANSSTHSLNFHTKISLASLKQPTTEPFIELNKAICEYKNEHSKIRNTVSSKIKEDTRKLQNTIDNLLIRITELLDNEILLKETIVNKDLTIKRLKEELQSLKPMVKTI